MLIFIRRDLRSFSGGRTFGEFFFQSLLPIVGTILMLSALCAVGIIVLSFFNGYRAHLEELEADPSASAISLEGHFRKGAPRIDFQSLVWNKEFKKFETSEREGPSQVKIVRFVSPYRQRGLFCIDRNDYLADSEVFWGTTVRASDENTKRSVVDSFVLPGRYFESDDDQGLIISLSLYKAMGYEMGQPVPESIKVLAPNVADLPYHKIKGIENASPFTKKETAEQTISIPLIGIARTLPDGSFLMTEGLFWNLQERKGIYDKSRTVGNFSVEFTGDSLPVLNSVVKWIESEFGNEALKHPPKVAKDMGKKCIVIAFKPLAKPVGEKGEGLGSLPSAGAIENSFHSFFDALSIDTSLNLGKAREYKGEIESYSGTMLFLNNISEVFNNIDKLYFFFKKKNIYANTHQMETIKKYRQDMNLISTLLPLILGSCVLLIMLYVLVSFTLFIQNKRHKIGVMLALGATSNMVRSIYVLETSILFLGSYLIALLINAIVSQYVVQGDWPFSFNALSNLGFFLSAFIMANLAGLFAVRHTLNKMPLNLITFRE